MQLLHPVLLGQLQFGDACNGVLSRSVHVWRFSALSPLYTTMPGATYV
jgi:hypothetical protein